MAPVGGGPALVVDRTGGLGDQACESVDGGFGRDRADFGLAWSVWFDHDDETWIWEVAAEDSLKLDPGAELEIVFRERGAGEQQLRVAVREGEEIVGRFVLEERIYADAEALADGRGAVAAALEDAIIG